MTPQSLAIMAGTLGVWAASHAIGVGFVVDTALLGVGAVALGSEVIDVITHFYDFASGAMNAHTEADLGRAGDHLAEAVTTIGIDAAAAFLTRGVVKHAKPPQIGTVQVVEMTNGVRVPVWVRSAKNADELTMESRGVTQASGRRNIEAHEATPATPDWGTPSRYTSASRRHGCVNDWRLILHCETKTTLRLSSTKLRRTERKGASFQF